MSYENPIPPMDDPMGKHWKQPKRENILMSDSLAVMLQEDFDRLAEYSSTLPSGVYPGKMWRAKWSDGLWRLCWYGVVPGQPAVCSNNSRVIMVL